MMKKKENKRIYKILSWLAVILWMVLIFCLSAQVAEQSSKLSTGVTEIIIEIIQKVVPKVEIDIHHFGHVIRKLAHFFSYLVLGVLVLNAFQCCGINGHRSIVLSAVVCVLYAASDEIHQLYVPGRGGQIRDVIIDSSGACVGFLLYVMMSKLVVPKKDKTKFFPNDNLNNI